MKFILVFAVGCACGAVGMTLVSAETYKSAKQETRTHIDSAVSAAGTAAHHALQEGAEATK